MTTLDTANYDDMVDNNGVPHDSTPTAPETSEANEPQCEVRGGTNPRSCRQWCTDPRCDGNECVPFGRERSVLGDEHYWKEQENAAYRDGKAAGVRQENTPDLRNVYRTAPPPPPPQPVAEDYYA